jgi:anti-sigma regulatory factor (Ser/Thr protein kinase)
VFGNAEAAWRPSAGRHITDEAVPGLFARAAPPGGGRAVDEACRSDRTLHHSGAADSMERSFDFASLTDLREEVVAYGLANGLADLRLTKFVLAVHEVMVNAVQHGGGRGRLELWRTTDDLWGRVTDTGPGIPKQYAACQPRRSKGDRIGGGYGLWLVCQFCAEVRIARAAAGGAEVVLRYPVRDAAA